MIQLLFIAAVGALIAWCGAPDPRAEVRRALAWRPGMPLRTGRSGKRRRSAGSRRAAATGTASSARSMNSMSDTEWDAFIRGGGLSDLADLDTDVD